MMSLTRSNVIGTLSQPKPTIDHNDTMNLSPRKIQFVEELTLGATWVEHSQVSLSAYRTWYQNFNGRQSLDPELALQAIDQYFPKFAKTFEQMINLLSLTSQDVSLLSFFCPPIINFACSQAAWCHQYPVLVRNYDYFSDLSEGRYLHSRWHKAHVIASSDCLWGALDGMNEFGLSGSVTLVGTEKLSEGFSAPVVLRYILEFCTNTQEAVDTLLKIPLCTAYNFTFLDTQFNAKTVEVNPVTGIHISSSPVATNHQGEVDEFRTPHLYDSSLRKQSLLSLLASPYTSLDSFIDAFAYYPLFKAVSYSDTSTLYTAIYNSLLKAAEYRFPNGQIVYQSLGEFKPMDLFI